MPFKPVSPVSAAIRVAAPVVGALLLAASVRADAPVLVDGVPLDVAQSILQIEALRLPADSLRPWATDPSAAIRKRTALAVGRLRDAHNGPEILDRLVRDPVVDVRQEAAFALGQTPDSAPVLYRAWDRERDPKVRAALAVALGKQGGPQSVSLLLEALSGGSGGLWDRDAMGAAVAEGLGRLGMRKVEGSTGETVARRLTDTVELPFGSAKPRAAWALARLGLTSASDTTIQRMGELAEHDPDPAVRAWMVRAWSGVATGDERADRLERLVRDPAAPVRIAAARSIAKQCPKNAEALLSTLVRDPSEGVVLEAVTAAGACPNAHPATLVGPSLQGPVPRVQAAALAALATAGAVPGELTDWLGADHPLEVRVAAAHALKDRPRLLSLAMDAPEPALRSAAAEALLGLTPSRPADLTALLGASDPVIATAAADTLRTSPDATAERALVARLGKGDLDDANAATFLRALGTLYGTGKISAPVPEALQLLPKWLGLPGLGAEAARIAAVLKLPVPDAGHAVRRVPALTDVLPVRSARIFTDEGEIRISLNPVAAPYTVWNFATLADKGYFDGVSFHRVVPDFVVQAGDPRGDGWGGPGWEIPDEINQLPYDTGAVGMALSGPDTGGSQWFITLSPQPHLEGTYTVFGHVLSGQRNAAALDQGERIRHIEIERVGG